MSEKITGNNAHAGAQKNMKAIPVFLAFLCMGFGDAVGPFVGLARDHFSLSSFEATIIAFAGFIMFGLLSVPMGLVQDQRGKKFVLMLGLIVALVGLVIPLFGLSSYALFLLTVLLLGGGNAILQVAGNPIMRDVSPQGKYSRNLSLGQFVKAIGSLTGPLLPVLAARWLNMGWEILFPVYSSLVLLTIVIVKATKIKEKEREPNTEPATFKSSFKLLSNRYVLMMVMAIFVYVGAEVCMSSGLPMYLEDNFGIDISKMGLAGTGLFFLALMVGRFLGATILNFMSPQRFFVITNIISIIGILGLFAGNQTIGFVSAFVIGLGFANIFPLVFSITVDNMPERANELSGLMVTAIVGGAFIPPLMGAVADFTTVLTGFLVPLAAIVYITITSFVELAKK